MFVGLHKSFRDFCIKCPNSKIHCQFFRTGLIFYLRDVHHRRWKGHVAPDLFPLYHAAPQKSSPKCNFFPAYIMPYPPEKYKCGGQLFIVNRRIVYFLGTLVFVKSSLYFSPLTVNVIILPAFSITTLS